MKIMYPRERACVSLSWLFLVYSFIFGAELLTSYVAPHAPSFIAALLLLVSNEPATIIDQQSPIKPWEVDVSACVPRYWCRLLRNSLVVRPILNDVVSAWVFGE